MEAKQIFWPIGGIKVTYHKTERVYFDIQFDPAVHTSYEAYSAYLDQEVQMLPKSRGMRKMKDCITLGAVITQGNKISIEARIEYTFEK